MSLLTTAVKKNKWSFISITSLVILVLLLIWVPYLVKSKREVNVYDEIFWNTKRYSSRGYEKLPDIEGMGGGGYEVGSMTFGPSYHCTELCVDEEYKHVFLNFYFQDLDGKEYDIEEASFSMLFDWQFDSDTEITIFLRYHPSTKVLEREFFDAEKNRFDSLDEGEPYLREHGVTVSDLDAASEKFMSEFLLPGWASVYSSRFAPDGVGDVVVEDWKAGTVY